MMSSRKVEEDIATSSQNFDKKFLWAEKQPCKIGIGEYGIKREEIDTGVEILNASSDSESESEE